VNPSRRHVDDILDAALAAVEPEAAVRRVLAREGRTLSAGGKDFQVAGRLLVLALGKAAVPMTRAALEVAGDLAGGGLVVTHARLAGLERIGPLPVVEAGHPLPDGRSVEAGVALAALISEAGPGELILALLSGGGSALAAAPALGLTLEDLAATADALLRGGASIEELNAVRKHLSAISGGRLARLSHPAPVLVLALSDVPGDPLDVIASGPFAPDPTTFDDALTAIQRLRPERVPPRVVAHLERGARGGLPETPKAGDPVFDRVTHVLVGGGTVAAKAAVARARALGYDAAPAAARLEGEARDAGRRLAAEALELARGPRAACRVWTGETAVTVAGRGTGGRNQELALAAALDLDGAGGALVAAFGTDGRDGPTDAAGGVADGGTAGRIRAAGLDPEALLRDNDSHRALAAAGDLLVTGPTGTNVADLVVVLTGEPPPRPSPGRGGGGGGRPMSREPP
jgi:hydroxypyruvate reductase